MAAKLHELTASIDNLKGQADKVRTELLHTFKSKGHHFTETLTTFTPHGENATATTEQQSSLQSTVAKELDWLSGLWSKAIDAGYQIAEGDTRAVADIVLDDGTTIAKDIPALALLELEKRVGAMHELAQHIPTLDPAKGFTPDRERGEHIYKAREIRKTRTKKIPVRFVKAEATDKHPAQVDILSSDEPIGTILELEWSGLITPAQKSEILDRADRLRRAIKEARARANRVDVKADLKIGRTLLDFVFKAAA
jgi:hypothetical protein